MRASPTLRFSGLRPGSTMRVQLAGIPIPDSDVLEPARLLGSTGEPDLAARLEEAWESETRVIALTIPELGDDLSGPLHDPQTDALSELRGVLLAEHVGRHGQGLVFSGGLRRRAVGRRFKGLTLSGSCRL